MYTLQPIAHIPKTAAEAEKSNYFHLWGMLMMVILAGASMIMAYTHQKKLYRCTYLYLFQCLTPLHNLFSTFLPGSPSVLLQKALSLVLTPSFHREVIAKWADLPCKMRKNNSTCNLLATINGWCNVLYYVPSTKRPVFKNPFLFVFV